MRRLSPFVLWVCGSVGLCMGWYFLGRNGDIADELFGFFLGLLLGHLNSKLPEHA